MILSPNNETACPLAMNTELLMSHHDMFAFAEQSLKCGAHMLSQSKGLLLKALSLSHLKAFKRTGGDLFQVLSNGDWTLGRMFKVQGFKVQTLGFNVQALGPITALDVVCLRVLGDNSSVQRFRG